jgi:hypothetical protein
MPKLNKGKRNSAAQGSPYANAAAKANAANSIFKMNKDVGQHVLKNPGIAQVGPVHSLCGINLMDDARPLSTKPISSRAM